MLFDSAGERFTAVRLMRLVALIHAVMTLSPISFLQPLVVSRLRDQTSFLLVQ